MSESESKPAAAWKPSLNIATIKASILGIKGNFVTPEMPKLVEDLNSLLNQKFPNTRDVTNLIEDNNVVTGDILGMVNSATFQSTLSKPIEIRTIRQCLVLFGVEKVYQMATASAMKGIVYQDPVIDKIVNSSAIMAKSCSIIARAIPDVSVQVAYFYGLFLHSGMVVLAMQKNQNYGSIFDLSITNPAKAIEMETEQYGGARHDYLGVAVARKWGIGMHPNNAKLHAEDTAILMAIQEHHNPLFYAIDDDTIRNLISVAHLAQFFMTQFVHNQSISEDQQRERDQAVALLGLDEKELEDITRMVKQSLFY